MTKITPVILAGGTGTRLWPVSRQSHPKQFSIEFDGYSLFQRTVLRFHGPNCENYNQIVVITHSEYRFIVQEQLQELGLTDYQIILEPSMRGTAPSILAASLFLANKYPEAKLLVVPSDHEINNNGNFLKSVEAAHAALRDKKIVTFGIVPVSPETGYGYIEAKTNDEETYFPVLNFIEKPKLEKAVSMSMSSDFFWNSGIFLFSARDMISAFDHHAHEFLSPVKNSVRDGYFDLGFFRLEIDAYSCAPIDTIDYAIMEHVSNLVVVPMDCEWTDLGDWKAVAEKKNYDSNELFVKNTLELNCEDSFLYSAGARQSVVGIGLKNIIAVCTEDAVLVLDRECTQDVKQAVDELKLRGVKQAVEFNKDFRPWGWFESIAIGDGFQVKKIVVKPNASLSLQSHKYRSEHWVVVEGNAEVTIDKTVQEVQSGGSVYIPLGAVHRLRNLHQSSSMTLIEVQTGTYFGEDDIVRYDDIYNRN